MAKNHTKAVLGEIVEVSPLQTGPITDAGKAISKLNSVKHGLTAKERVITRLGETTRQRNAHDASIQHAFGSPVDDFERQMVADVADLLWRKRRVQQLHKAATELAAKRFSGNSLEDTLAGKPALEDDTVNHLAALPSLELMLKVQRAEAHINRQMRNLLSLISMKRRLNGASVVTEEEVTQKCQNETTRARRVVRHPPRS